MVWILTYIYEYNVIRIKVGSMYWSINYQKNACDQKNIEIEYLYFGFDIRMIFQGLIYCIFYYHTDRSNGR